MIRTPLLAAALAALAAAPLPAQERAETVLAMAGPELPPAAHWQQDPANELYRAAREALNRREYATAARLFQRIRQEHPSSRYTPDALYWEAFSRYRTGSPTEYRTALGALEAQRTRYPRAATRRDADELATRIRGELGRRGDSDAARQVERSAVRAARPGGPCGDGDDDTRVAALNALMGMDADRALPILERVLARRDDCSAELREKAVFMVSSKGTPAAEATLMRVARTDPSAKVREQAVFWLSQSRSEQSLRFIEEILRTSDDARVREKAIFALSQHGNPRAYAVLRAFAEESGNPRSMREKAIFWIGQRGTAESASYLRGLFGRVEPALKNSMLTALANSPGNERWLLGLAGDASEGFELRKQALFWAGQTRIATAELVGAYDALQDRGLKDQAIFVLSQRGDAAAIDKLIDIARRDPDRQLRTRAIFWLGQSRDPRAAQTLAEIIDS
jgi:HEAT repeat protein